MVDESIVIEVKDSVENSIAVKIKAIATEARLAHKDLGTLQKQLSALGVSKLGGVSSGASGAATATAKLATAQANLSTATARLQSAQNQAALSAQRLADAQDRAQKRTASAAQAATTAATASTKLNKGLKDQAIQFDKNGLSAKQYNAAMRGVPAQITDIVVSLQGGQAPLTVLLQQGGQLKDMFGGIRPAAAALTRGLVAMITPVTVLAAGVGVFVAGAVILESKLRVINGLVTQFNATGRSDVSASVITDLRKELALLPGVSKSTATEVIKNFADMRNIGGSVLKEASLSVVDLAAALGVDAPEASKRLAESLNDPLKGAQDLDKSLGFLTIQDFKTIASLDKLGKTAEAQKVLLDKLKIAIGGVSNDGLTPMQKATNDLGNAWNKFTGDLADSSVFKSVLDGLTGLVTGLSWIVTKLDTLFSMQPPAWLTTAMLSAAGGAAVGGLPGAVFGAVAGGLGGAAVSAVQGNSNTGGATGSWDTPRTAEQLKSTKFKTDAAGITGGKKDNGESRVTILKKITAQLENELSLQNMLGDAREKEEMFNRINEGLIGRKITLGITETKAIRDKIAAIVEGAPVASEAIRINEEANGVQLQYNATITAANELLTYGVINQDQYNKAATLASETIKNAQDPLRQFNKELDNQFALSKLTNKESEIESYMQGISNDLLAKNIDLKTTDNQTILKGVEALRARKTALLESNLVQAAENTLLGDSVEKRKSIGAQLQALRNLQGQKGFTAGDQATATTGIISGMGLDPTNLQVQADSYVSVFKTMYDQIAEMRKLSLIDDEQAASLKAQIAVKQTEVQLQGAKQFYSELVALQSSSVKEFAAIGKAAAIIQATINTYEGATKALAQGGVYGPILAGAVIASGMAQVAAISSQGFQSGGYTGNMATDAVAGVVHGKEFVMNADATAANRPMLEAMNRGAKAVGGNSIVGTGNNSGVNVTIENYGTSKDFEVQQLSETEIRIIARNEAKGVVQKDAPNVVAAQIRNPNSSVSKSLGQSTQTQRRR